MSATERLRALLDERGVKHTDPAEWLTYWNDADGHVWSASEMKTGLLSVSTAGVGSLTPEQAIDATLGPEDAYTREDVERAFVSGYSLGSLPVGSDPQWNQNEQTVDEHMAELGWVRKEGPGTCRPIISDNLNESEGTGDAWANCSECGHLLFALTDPNSQPPNYCPNCGRRVVK